MDKYEFNIKVEQMRKLVNKGDFETAMKIADTIDWKKVRNANLLSMVAQIYEKNKEYQDAKDILLLAFERAPIGKRLLYKLADLALKEGNVDEAEAYYREFCDLAGDDPRQYLLRYMILKQKDAPLEQLIHSLECYTTEELDEKWLYELAELYHQAGEGARCVSTCDKIMLMFGLGKYVDKAMELKIQYAPLTKYQMDLVENREKYEEKLRAVEQSFEEETYDQDNESEEAQAQTAAADEDSEEAVPEQENAQEQEAVQDSRPVISAEDVEVPELEPEKVVADVTQAEIEKNLAKEMTRLTEDAEPEEESELGKTRVLPELKRTAVAAEQQRAAVEPIVEPDPEPIVEDLDDEEDEADLPKMTNHLMIEARTPEKGLEIAIQTLKQIQKETGIKNPVAKITGSKLNKRGVLASAEKLQGKDLMIEEAGDLSHEMLKELEKLMTTDTTGMRIILIDNPKQMETLHVQNPTLADKFECIGCDYPYQPAAKAESPAPEVKKETAPEPVVDDRPVRAVKPKKDGVMRVPDSVDREMEQPETEYQPEDEMDIDSFAQYACKYASEIDCSITGKSMLALYERIEILEEDGIPLTRSTAEELIEEAADRAEKPSLGKRITGIFSSKYDKDGLLILKEEHFI